MVRSAERFARTRAVWGMLVLLVLLATRTAAADPLDPRRVPDPLKGWTEWALDGKADALCPQFLGHADTSRCAWPSRLDLTVEARGGRFVQQWHVDVARAVPLPGDDKRWPLDVKVDGARAVVAPLSGGPGVLLAAGDHRIEGAFAWDSPPDSLKVPEETGLLGLTLRGAQVAWPNRDAQGTVWLQKAATNEEGDALELVVHRKVTDDIPLVLTTRIELHVAGKNREELLGKALPAGFVPMALTGPLPARVEPDGRLRIQVRPGIYVLELSARSEGVVTSMTRPVPGGPWRDGDEVWVFEAKNDYRIVTVTGVASIDPQQTTLPEAWKRLPAYPMKLGATLVFEQKRRGDSDPPPDQLTLARTLWLDFDGAGYTASDKLSGTLQRDTRLTMDAPTVLGRVAIDGRDQFITHLAGSPLSGVEVRQGQLSASADSRIAGDPSDLPAVGWAHDFHQVSADLHLPPGWRLLHASGVDEVQGTWVKGWTLLELFLALIVAIGIGRLYGYGWGAVAAALLFLTVPEEGAPKWSWLFVLAAEALVRVLPAGTARKLFEGVRLAAIAIVVLIAVPFLVQHVREGLFPALATDSSIEDGSAPAIADAIQSEERAKTDQGVMGAAGGAGAAAPAAPPPAEPQQAMRPDMSRSQSVPGKDTEYRQSNSQVYDPNAMVQTGPGLPRWQWSTLALRWSGPVAASQRLHLYLLSPDVNLGLALVRAGLLILLILRLLPWVGKRLVGGGKAGAAGAAALALVLLVPAPAKADIPDAPTLQELATRLTRKPDCAPSCASASRMAIEVRAASLAARVEVDVSAPTAVPLPGARGEWAPSSVLLDAQPARALLRTDDGVLWIELAAGVHTIALAGPLPDRESVQLALRMKPHRVEVSADGWSVAGVHEDGLADDDLELTRTRREGDAGAPLEQGALPSFVRVERTLHAGLDWQVDTRVRRVTPPGAAVVLEVPLLPGESVTTADVRVEGGKALLNLAAQATEVAWHSVLEQKSPVALVAPKGVSWVEVWRVDVGPIWHATFTGIPAVHAQAGAGTSVPEWHPWPGERLDVDLVRPDGAPGQTLTIEESSAEVQPGQRATDVTLTLHLRSSRGGEHTIVLPPDAQLESLTINGATQPIRQQGARVTLPIVPGAQTAVLGWREGRGLSAVFTSSAIDLGEPSVNARLTIAVPGTQWLLFAGGPRVGPAVLFWSLLLVLLVVSLVLGRNRWTPLRWWHWLLLSIGLSQVSVEAGAVFVVWLLALGWRARQPADRGRRLFNLTQALLVLLTLAALGVLAVSLYQGLLGTPEMQVRGNGSSAALLQWFTDRSGPALPTAWMVSAPLLVYRGAMLAWALWSALALLGWLRWGWGAFTEGGGWRRSPPRPMPVMHPPMPPSPPMPPPGTPTG